MKNKITFVIGGCRSGKSSFALDLAEREKGKNKIFIATSVPSDSEMEKRVKKHQRERGDEWQTIEEPVKIYDKINHYSKDASAIVVDCLTLWISNLMFDASGPARIEQAVKQLKESLESCECPLFLVSNEVGTGIVPENKIARQFRDHAGFVNQRVAEAADTVFMTVAGIAVQIKPRP